jgi:hypothetical protein
MALVLGICQQKPDPSLQNIYRRQSCRWSHQRLSELFECIRKLNQGW